MNLSTQWKVTIMKPLVRRCSTFFILTTSVAVLFYSGHADAEQYRSFEVIGTGYLNYSPGQRTTAIGTPTGLLPSGAGGIGFRYDGPWTNAYALVRTGTQSTILTNGFGGFLLTPASMAVSSDMLCEWFPILVAGSSGGRYTADVGIHSSLEFGVSTWQIASSPDTPEPFTSETTALKTAEAGSGAFVIGPAIRLWPAVLEDTLRFWVVANVGYAARFLIDDAHNSSNMAFRKAALGSTDTYWHGPEFGLTIRIGKVELGARVPILFGTSGADVNGLTGPRVMLTAAVRGGFEFKKPLGKPGAPRGGND